VSLPSAAFAPLLKAGGRRRSKGGSSYLPRVAAPGTVRSQLHAAAMPDPASAPLRAAISPTGDMVVDEAAHRAQVAEHWAEGERFNLRQAFKSQMDRIESDWESYLQEMEVEYKTERAKMLGVEVNESMPHGPNKENGHWLAKEKQDTLIHTAPVLAPNTSFRAGGAKRATSRSVSASTRREVAALDGRFEEAKRQVIVQREEALRWTRRQSERMISQVDAQEAERREASMAHHKQEKTFDAMMQAVRDLTNRLALAMQATRSERGRDRPPLVQSKSMGSDIRYTAALGHFFFFPALEVCLVCAPPPHHPFFSSLQLSSICE